MRLQQIENYINSYSFFKAWKIPTFRDAALQSANSLSQYGYEKKEKCKRNGI